MQRTTLIGPVRKLFTFGKASPSSRVKLKPSIGLTLRPHSDWAPEKSKQKPSAHQRLKKDSKPATDGLLHPKQPPAQDIDGRLGGATTVSTISQPRRRFIPPTSDTKPLELFKLQLSSATDPPTLRLINKSDSSQILIFYSIYHRQAPTSGGLGIFFSLNDNISKPLLHREDDLGYTFNSANLFAANSALQLRDWRAEGFTKVVVATHIPSIVDGVSGKVAKWEEQKWISVEESRPIKNSSLWIDLLTTIKRLEMNGVDVQFWEVAKKDNLAIELAEKGLVPEVKIEARKTTALERSRLERRTKRKNPTRQMIGFMVLGGTVLIVSSIAVSFDT